MTQERFQQFLQNPELLTAIPYEELKTLALTYPYAANLHLLLFLKSTQENNPDLERNRATAAAYTIDRGRLLNLVSLKTMVPLPPVEVEVLDLKPLSELAIKQESPISLAAEKEIPHTSATTADPVSTSKEPASRPVPTVPFSGVERPVYDSTAEERILHFVAWANSFNLLPLSPTHAVNRPKKASTASSEAVAEKLAQESLRENPAVASETLANLYAQQGHRDKAVEIYRQLMLLHPEKTAFFAARIEALTKDL